MEIIENSIYKIPLTLDESLEINRNVYDNIVIKAQMRLKKFAETYRWQHFLNGCLIDRIFVFDSQKGLIEKIMEVTGAERNQLPSTVSGIIIKRDLLIISPEEYERIYPEGIDEDSYDKLITHELAHELHIQILDSREELMGPIWFFEGFAIFAAEQFSNYKLSEDEIWMIVRTQERISYKYYASVIRYFLSKTSLNQLVQNAGKEDFEEWLNSL